MYRSYLLLSLTLAVACKSSTLKENADSTARRQMNVYLKMAGDAKNNGYIKVYNTWQREAQKAYET